MIELPLVPAELEGPMMFFFSLWKTYIGPLMAAVLGYSYLEMLVYNLSGAMCSCMAVLYASDALGRYARRPPRGFNRNLRRVLRFWRRRGERTSALLSPILLGIPTFALVARKLRAPRRQVLAQITIASAFWSSLFYFAAAEVLALSAWLSSA